MLETQPVIDPIVKTLALPGDTLVFWWFTARAKATQRIQIASTPRGTQDERVVLDASTSSLVSAAIGNFETSEGCVYQVRFMTGSPTVSFCGAELSGRRHAWVTNLLRIQPSSESELDDAYLSLTWSVGL